MRGRHWALRGIVAAALAFAAFQLGLAAPDDAGRAVSDEGSVAPNGCWSTTGGNPARTAAAATAPVTGDVSVAWEWTGKGEIESEPLVWGNVVYVSTREKDSAVLTALALSNGKQLSRKSWHTPLPLLANVWNGIVVVRSAPQRVDALRLRSDGFLGAGYFETTAPVHDLLLFKREIYVRAGDQVMRYDVGGRSPVWTQGKKCRGRLALRGLHVFGVEYDDAGNAELFCHGRTDGRALWAPGLGHHEGKTPEPGDAAPRVQVFETEVRVLHDLNVVTADRSPANVSAVPRSAAKDGSTYFTEARLNVAAGEAAAWPGGWVGPMLGKTGQPELWATAGESRYWTLATAASNAQFGKPSVPPSVTGGVAYVGAAAADLNTRDILWSLDMAPLFRAVPARDTVLVARAGGRLVALREPRPADAPASPVSAAPEAGVQGRVVLRDGSVVTGLLRMKAGGPVTVDGTPPRSIPLADVLIAEDAAGTFLAAAPAGEAAEGLDVLALRETAQAYAAVAVQSVASRDPVLVERLLSEATTRGAEPKDVARAESGLKDILGRSKAPLVNAEETAKTLAAEREAAATPARVFWERRRRLPETAPRGLVIELLSRVLESDPKHADATASVRSMLPAGITPPEPFDPRDWLSFLRAMEFTPVELVKPPKQGDEDISPGQRMLGMYLSVWRRDLVALQSRQLLVISAPVKPGRIANCISAGELLCDTLERVFASGKHVRDKRWPMMILLFEDRDEYLRVLGKSQTSQEEARMLEWSIGQYSPGDGSRLYLPEDEEGFQRVQKTFIHELTHQWLAERCPLYSAAESGVSRNTRSHFVVEGFAEMMEEMRFDVRRRTCTFDPRCPSLDTLAALRPAAVFPWERFLTMDADGFRALSHEDVIEVRRRRALSGSVKISEGHVFYDQGAATCHWLYEAEGGKYRQAFLEFTAAQYAGRAPEVKDAFGMTAAELGAKVLAFAASPSAK